SGGAVLVVNQSTDKSHVLEIVRSTFSNNSSVQSSLLSAGNGAVSFRCGFGARNCTAKISSSRFSNNRATGSGGGALHLLGDMDASVANARFESNEADEGGAIFSDPQARVQGGGTFSNPAALSNPKLLLQTSIFKNNRAKTGGAVRMNAGNLVGQA